MPQLALHTRMQSVTDWQGDKAAVVTGSGSVVQQTIYYPYGEPTVEPGGQRAY